MNQAFSAGRDEDGKVGPDTWPWLRTMVAITTSPLLRGDVVLLHRPSPNSRAALPPRIASVVAASNPAASRRSTGSSTPMSNG